MYNTEPQALVRTTLPLILVGRLIWRQAGLLLSTLISPLKWQRCNQRLLDFTADFCRFLRYLLRVMIIDTSPT